MPTDLERERKLQWYHKNAYEVNRRKHQKRNKVREEKGLPSIEKEFANVVSEMSLRATAIQYIKFEKAGSEVPKVLTKELQDMIDLIKERKNRHNEQNKKRRHELQKERKEYQEYLKREGWA